MSAWENYYRELTRLYVAADSPSSRGLAELAGGGMSHTTVNALIKGRRMSGKVVTRRLIDALDGDWESFEPLWIAATVENNGMTSSEVPAPPSGSAVLAELLLIRTLLEQLVSERQAPIYPLEICGDMNGPNGVGGECVMPAGHQHRDGIGGEWPLEEK